MRFWPWSKAKSAYPKRWTNPTKWIEHCEYLGYETNRMPTPEQVAAYISELPKAAASDMTRAQAMVDQQAPAWAFAYRQALLALIQLTESRSDTVAIERLSRAAAETVLENAPQFFSAGALNDAETTIAFLARVIAKTCETVSEAPHGWAVKPPNRKTPPDAS